MRRPRILMEGARYHVCARANRKEMVLDRTGMKDLFLQTLSRAKRKYSFRVENFCIMGNHVHLILVPNSGQSLSSIMQWILSVFASAWNRLHHLTGHLWGERFVSRIISSLRQFELVSHYLDNNPVLAGLVKKAEDWPYGGAWYRVSKCSPYAEASLLDRAPV